MTTTARELAEKLYKEWIERYGIAAFYANNNYKEDGAACEGIIREITSSIEQAFARGRESVLSRVPKTDEIQKESDDHYVTLEGRMVYFDKAFHHGVEFVIAKLKEPT